MKIIRYAVSHPVTVSMVTLAAVVFGLVALGRLDMQLLPDIRYPSLTVQTEFPNTAPQDVENLVTRPLEEAVGVVPGLRKVHSISQSGLSQITLEFGWGTRMDYAALDAREKIDLIELPAEAKTPLLLKYDPTQDPILRIGLWGEAPLVQLRHLAEDVIKKEIESLQGIAAAKVAGGLEEEIHVEVDEARLASLGIPITAVSEALAQENINASGGRLRDRNAEYIVRTLSRFENLEDIERVPVTSIGGQPVRLRDVGRVFRTHKERESITHVSGTESVEIAIYKEGDENIVAAASRVRRHLDSLQKRLPAGVKLEILFDQSVFIGKALREVRNNALLGGLLAIIVLYVFLRDIRSTLIIGLAIPVAIVATFILMYSRGVSLNIMSLGGLALGVGMLVDNSIVVLEAIHRRRQGARAEFDPVGSTIQGASEVAGAVTASTLTTLAVFVPIVFVVVGIAGQIFGDQALTVTFSLLVSLIVALTFTPMAVAFGRRRARPQPVARVNPEPAVRDVLEGATVGAAGQRPGSSRWFRRLGRGAGRTLCVLGPALLLALLLKLVQGLRVLLVTALWPLTWLFGRVYPVLTRSHERILSWSLAHRWHVLAGVALLALGAVGLVRSLGTELIPPLAQGEFTLVVELPEGTPLSRTEETVTDLERRILTIPKVEQLASDLGISREGETSVQRRKENQAEIHVKLARAGESSESRVLGEIRDVLAQVPDLVMRLRRPSLFTFDAPVEVHCFGYDLDALQDVTDRVAAELAQVEGLRDIRPSMLPGSPEIRVSFDRDKLNLYGLNLAEVAETVRGKVRGTVASQMRDREHHIDIRVQNQVDQRSTLAAVQDLIVAERQGIPIPLVSVARMEVRQGPAEIHRLGRKRVAIVSANLTGRDLGSVTAEMTRRLARLPLPAGVSVELGGQNEEMQQSYHSFLMAILLAVFLVYLVMAAQFESFLHPLIIIFTVPLALIGAVYGLALTGTHVSVIAAIGAIMLAGIVVNNGIVLVDRINQLRRRQPLQSAVEQASSERFRPILMTTATTVLGLLPMALGLGEGAELRAPLAITVISGLVVATVLTLVVVPVIYTLLTREGLAQAATAAQAALRPVAFIGHRMSGD